MRTLCLLLLCAATASGALQPGQKPQTVVGAGGSAGSPVDMFWDGEGTGTVTRIQLARQTHAVSAAGQWTITDNDPDTDITFNTSGQLANLRNPVSVSGRDYSGSGTTGFRLDVGTDATSECRYTVRKCSWIFAGFFFKVNTELDFANCDILELRGNTGKNFGVFQWRSNDPAYVNAHSELGEGNRIAVTNNTLYWGQFLYTQNTNIIAAVWLVSNWSFLGSSTNTFGPSPAGGTPVDLIIGPQFGTHGQTSPALPYQYFDNFVFKWSGTIPDPTVLFP